MALAASSSRCIKPGVVSACCRTSVLRYTCPAAAANNALLKPYCWTTQPHSTISTSPSSNQRRIIACGVAKPHKEGAAQAGDDTQEAGLPDAAAAAAALAPAALQMDLSEVVGMLSMPDDGSSSSSSSSSSSGSSSSSDSDCDSSDDSDEEQEGECECGKDKVLDKAARAQLKAEEKQQKDTAKAEEKQQKQALKMEKKQHKEEEREQKQALKAEKKMHKEETKEEKQMLKAEKKKHKGEEKEEKKRLKAETKQAGEHGAAAEATG
ncbi:hypothetical protein OEZ86_007729 [Tetradesmus obliquus]|nr:hypothetical protein OEZ86_007729 [Tetradesmus obliquus]